MRLALLISLALGTTQARAASPVDTIAQRIRDTLLNASVSASTVQAALAHQANDGSFDDIDYASTSVTAWKPTLHPQRLQAMALAWAKPGSAWFQSDTLLARLRGGFDFWVARNPKSANWWHNEIGAAHPWGQALVLTKGAFPDSSLGRWALYIHSNWARWTGANLTDEGTVHIYRCIARDEPAGIDSVIRAIRASVVVVDSGDGIHPDFSFAQHSLRHFLYNGGYGETYLTESVKWWRLVEGTSFAFPRTQTDLLVSELLDGSAWMVHARRYDPSVVGRGIARTGTHGGGGLAWDATLLAGGGTRQSELDAFSRWLQGTGPWPWAARPDRLFWTCQYLTHHGPGWMISVRSARPDVVGAESINGENLKGWFLPYGATWIHVRGDEHDQIWPALDWARIPGVTIDHVDTFPASKNNGGWGHNTGTAKFSGGASDGIGAAMALDYSVSEITGKKAWFQTPDALVALGAGLAFGKPRPVATTLDQRLARGEVSVGWADGSRTRLGTDSASSRKIRWLHHDSVGYWIPAADSLVVASRSQSGSWKAIDTQYSDSIVTRRIFSARVEHGQNASGESYAYAVVPGISADSMDRWVATAPVKIESNGMRVQAVSEGSWRGVVFHAADSVAFAAGLSIGADAPCAMVVRDSAGGLVLTVADPGQSSARIGLRLSWGRWTETRIVALPGGSMAGSPVRVWLPASLPTAIMASPGRRDWKVVHRGQDLKIVDLPAHSPAVRVLDASGRILWNASPPEGQVELDLPRGAGLRLIQVGQESSRTTTPP